jgi:cytochrome oxidase Cu insertion factor (SCO1/SenC/PrrC family)
VFVATNSKYDTREALTKFRDSMFGKDLICLLGDPANPVKMQQILRKFKVPEGLTTEEAEQTIALFSSESEKTFIGRLKRKLTWQKTADDLLNDHSRVMYLFSDDNKFLNFYPLDIDERELLNQIIEEIGFDIGQRYLGTGMKP